MPILQRAILFLVDGLRPDAVAHAHTPAIDSLAARGAYTWQAQTVTPSITLPCLASLFLGVPPARHGVVGNVWTSPQPPVPSLIDRVHQAGLGAAAFYSWEPCRDLARPGALDFAYYHHDSIGDRDAEIASVAAQYIAQYKPVLAFVYLGATDIVGHSHGWMSDAYLRTVTEADRAIGLALETLQTSGNLVDTICAVLADHGGHGRQHGSDVAEDLTIPWILSGPGVRRGQEIAGDVSILDTAPTLLHLLGLPMPQEMSDHIVTEALASQPYVLL